VPDASDQAVLADLLRALGTFVKFPKAFQYEVATTVRIGGTYQGEGRPFDINWRTGERYPGEEKEFPRRDEIIGRHFGFLPASEIDVSASLGRDQDHRILGELVLYMAQSFGGIVDFGGALMPASTWTSDESDRILQVFEEANWQDVSTSRDRFFRSMPGRIAAIPYQTASGRTWVSHVCDCEFMRAWLQHPDFYMIK
jgi:hypothetical protein